MSSLPAKPAAASLFTRFYERTLSERLHVLVSAGFLDEALAQKLGSGQLILSAHAADRMVENVIGTFGLPMGLGLNFIIDQQAHVVPMVTEEPSIIAAVSAAAKTFGSGGGIETEAPESYLIGQIQVVDVSDVARAQQALVTHRQRVLSLANSLHPNMVARGGGAKELAIRHAVNPRNGRPMLIVHLVVDTCDAMGANLVNTMCEGVAGLIEELSEGRVFLRILSNLCDRAMVRARVAIAPEQLEGKGFSGEAVRDGIVAAGDFASADIYRAATHNKGILNGIDAVALATGNDWRAIGAAAHAWAGRGDGYHPLTAWQTDLAGRLVGTIELPLKVGTKGGNFSVNPMVAVAQKLLGEPDAARLARIMAAVGLAQNFAALRALATEGIQAGHMTLHARSVVASAGAEPELFDEVVEAVVKSGEIKLWQAERLLAEARDKRRQKKRQTLPGIEPTSSGFGKVLLAGEHAVVYGSHALAVPIPLAARAWITPSTQPGAYLMIPQWGVEQRLRPGAEGHSLGKSLQLIWERLKLGEQDIVITVHPEVPRAMGLGSSAALAVAVVRAVNHHFKLCLDDASVSALAFEAEKVAHGTPSGVDNAVATMGRPILFRRGEPEPLIAPVNIAGPTPLVVGLTKSESLTAKTVRQVRMRRERNPQLVNRLFEDIDQLALRAVDALGRHDLSTLGELMDLNHGLLHALHVSTPEIEWLVHLARQHGALGAKVTGGGGGGSMVAVCSDDASADRVQQAMQTQGFDTLRSTLEPTSGSGKQQRASHPAGGQR